jgi:hypothetical protein
MLPPFSNPVVVNSEIAYLRLNPNLEVQPHALGSGDAVWTRTDECLKLLGFAIGKCLMKGDSRENACRRSDPIVSCRISHQP